ncbi:hypothetical protein I6414_07430 [Helicobacter pylori]|nr:hypothetical protein [Helicobacter pylori]OPG64969.1 hypothetical protein BGL84_04250 [Helicobacter pylori]
MSFASKMIAKVSNGMCFLPSYLLEPYEKLLTPEARKLLEQQALDCLKNAKTEADRKECNYLASSKLLNFLMLTF